MRTENGFRNNPMAVLVAAPASRFPVTLSDGNTDACVGELREGNRVTEKYGDAARRVLTWLRDVMYRAIPGTLLVYKISGMKDGKSV